MSSRAAIYKSTFRFFRTLRKLQLFSKKKLNVQTWLLIKKMLGAVG